MDSSLIDLARFNLLFIGQAKLASIMLRTEDFWRCSYPNGGWLFLEANLGVSEGRYHCVL